MLKVVSSEVMNSVYMVHRMMLLFTRTKGIPKIEPSGISVGHKNDLKRFLTNDVEAY